MQSHKEYFADKEIFSAFIKKAYENNWLRTSDVDYTLEILTYFDTRDLDLYRKNVTAAHGQSSEAGRFLFFSEEDNVTTYALRGCPDRDPNDYSNIFHLAAVNVYDVTKELHPIFHALTDKSVYDLDGVSKGQENSIIRVSFNDTKEISLSRQKGQMSLETISIEKMVGSQEDFYAVETLLKEIISEKLGMEAFETSIAETGFEFHKKFMPDAKNNLGNYMTCNCQ